MEKYIMFLDWKNQYSENKYTTQSNLKTQCNPYQTINGIFHRTRTNNFTIYMEIRKPRIAKEILRKKIELEESTCLTSGSNTKPQSSRQYGTGTKTNTDQRNKIESPEINPCPLDTLSSTKEARIYNGEKTTCLTVVLGKLVNHL